MSRLVETWDRLTPTEKLIWQGTVWSAILFLLHFDLYTTWFIEDAAISFAFARNLALGEGLVAYPGGEPVEGFSNPTWTLSLAALRVLGITPFISAKLLGALAGLLTLPLAALWVNSMRGKSTPLAALAPLLLALSPQFVAWNASGLENSFFSLLLAAGCVSLIRQTQDPSRYPWAGLLWAALAITRPEAPVYALIGLGIGSVWIWRLHGAARLGRWALTIGSVMGLPFIAWHTWRYTYFAWEFPNTYYAKLGEDRFSPWGWDKRGWNYLRGFALSTAHGFLIPLYVLGQTGFRGKWPLVGLTLTGAALLLTLPGLGWVQDALSFAVTWEDPEWLMIARVLTWGLLAAAIPLMGLGREGAMPRFLAWAYISAVLFYTLYVGGDWMAGFRWFSLMSVPLLVLLADGIISVSETLGTRGFIRSRRLALAALVGIPGLVGAGQSTMLISFPETSPYDVRRRVLYIEKVRQQLGIDHITQMEVDMGAHMWWGDAHYIDMAGLTDVPMGHHKWGIPFVKEYVYDERKPEFAHVHGGWAKRTKMRRHADWRNYLEMPAYPANVWNRHEGNFIRRDLVFQPKWPGGTARQVAFGPGVELVGWHAPSLPAVPGQRLHLTVGWRRGRTRVLNFRAYVYLANDEHITVQEIPPIYDWVPPSRWRRSELAMSHHQIPVPDDFTVGRYDLGLLVLDATTGEIVAAKAPEGSGTIENPRLGYGEARWPKAIGIVGPEKRDEVAAKRLLQLDKQAGQGKCEAAVNHWKVFRGYYPDEAPLVQGYLPSKTKAIARCYSEASVKATDEDQTAAMLAKALRWQHTDPQVRARALLFADNQEAQGEQHLASGMPEEAYNSWHRALVADPSRSQLRRRTEALRDQRLFKPDEEKVDAKNTLD
jgi:hypothetical protein